MKKFFFQFQKNIFFRARKKFADFLDFGKGFSYTRHVPKGERNFKLIPWAPFWSVEAKIADLSFSAKTYFLCKFWKIRKKFEFFYRGLKFFMCELRSETFLKQFSKKYRCLKKFTCELRSETGFPSNSNIFRGGIGFARSRPKIVVHLWCWAWRRDQDLPRLSHFDSSIHWQNQNILGDVPGKWGSKPNCSLACSPRLQRSLFGCSKFLKSKNCCMVSNL